MYTVGLAPGSVYTTDDRLKGKGAAVGTRGVDSQGREFVMVMVGASQNLTNGMAVVINSSTFLTTLGTAAAAGVPNLGPVAIVYCSITASTSTLVWAQVYGLCTIASFAATTSATPGAAIKFSADGTVTAASVTTASAYIAGMNVVATVSAVGAGSVFLNYPRAIGG